MMDWKQKYETLQKTHAELLRKFNSMERKYRYLSKRVQELEDQIFHGRIPVNRPRMRAERLFESLGHDD